MARCLRSHPVLRLTIHKEIILCVSYFQTEIKFMQDISKISKLFFALSS